MRAKGQETRTNGEVQVLLWYWGFCTKPNEPMFTVRAVDTSSILECKSQLARSVEETSRHLLFNRTRLSWTPGVPLGRSLFSIEWLQDGPPRLLMPIGETRYQNTLPSQPAALKRRQYIKALLKAGSFLGRRCMFTQRGSLRSDL